ncbi:MAG: DNA repair protein RecN [Chitinophagaceae bacterium]|nr:DNA repair protein RecN [Chitinophagaceae bacterium]MCA6452695.1 DNA repair protein RecN [Chitinophagaceae bacterium]MCA6455200.1 DNA repair protein RecN [Chitinophagaceae bacterium]MCA6459586.1 DNA repair protein RecN [Chitinophagaceae bacterium]MCA6464453.1 DNA repair protein RecN [Chitinophagaceae bacterium]
MLRKLIIQNYAIIDEIAIDFSSQLNIITGETGAGKSILMGALSLILGERADSSVLVNTEKKCFIEGYFAVNHKRSVIHFLEENDLDVEEELVLRREIAANGKSRAFINDTPATLQQLKVLASLLVDLHQQFDTLELGDADFQREVMDALAGNEQSLLGYQKVFRQWQTACKELEQLQQQKAAFTKELDYNQFLFDELNELDLKENELEDLDNELKLLTNAEGIKTTLSKVYFDLKESEQPVVQLLKQLLNQLQGYASYHTNLPNVIERLQSSQIELQDIADEVERINDSVNFDEKRIEWINQRLMEGYKLAKKHNVQTTAQLLEIQGQLEEKLKAVLDMDDALMAKEKQTGQLLSEARKLADLLSQARHKQSKPLEEKVNQLLAQVGMPNARMKVELKDNTLTLSGKDQIDFLFDANKSNRFEPIRKVASGGELSRLMLCIKSLVAQSIDLPTLIFDEIDTGISGEAAKQVGLIMKGLAGSRQIICITHQPQIAGKANAHFFVYKEIKNDAVKTNIRLLNEDERITAIARMLSGEKPTAAAMENAREMMN